ncbi:hypothetical protein MY092_003817 [Salmonella enterica]|uniref:hypothetical protein n=1 Tax=Salmonella enterica TaxID=28901 RepID=UPI001CBD6E01|nr:hypothetical protein [Salmonella enterica]EJC4646424.1 hypothetical protein [Salmonella enterica]EKQ9927794.1 hypothetical protein [Salmonella enterica subsp. enterica serovar Panama]
MKTLVIAETTENRVEKKRSCVKFDAVDQPIDPRFCIASRTSVFGSGFYTALAKSEQAEACDFHLAQVANLPLLISAATQSINVIECHFHLS